MQPSKPRVPVDVALAATYFCNIVVLTLPVLLVPLMAPDPSTAASFAAKVASVATLGGGIGKFVNGFVCQAFGAQTSSAVYLVGSAVSYLLLSMMPSTASVRPILAAVEFFASLQWTACLVVLTNHYEAQPAKLAAGIGWVSIASTVGTIAAKLVGSAVLQWIPSWKILARAAVAIALLGAVIVQSSVQEHPVRSRAVQRTSAPPGATPKRKTGVLDSIRDVLGSRLFGQAGLAHGLIFAARKCDGVLGPFFQVMTGFPPSVCGALTVSVTLGFVLGLSNAARFYRLPDSKSKLRTVRKWYTAAVASAFGLGILSIKAVSTRFLASPYLVAGVLSALSASMAAFLSFQFYQVPSLIATKFGDNKAVCLSFFDGMGFFISAPIWAVSSNLIDSGAYGWSLQWSLLGSMFAVGAGLMLDLFPRVIAPSPKDGRRPS